MVRPWLVAASLCAGACAEPGAASSAATTASSMPLATSTSDPSDGTTAAQESSGTATVGSDVSSTGARYPAGPYGIEVGDVLAPLSFLDQTGAEVSTEGAHGAPQRVFVVFGTAAW